MASLIVELLRFVNDHGSAVFGLLGAVVVGVTGFLSAWYLKKREYDLRVWETLIDRRIKAHDQLMQVAKEMQVVTPLAGVEPGGGLRRAPAVLMSRQVYLDWARATPVRLVGQMAWLSREPKREASFVQDYLVNLNSLIARVPDGNLPKVGEILRQDFVDIANSLEKTTHRFYRTDVLALKAGDLDEWHKYPRSQAEARLDETLLRRRFADLEALVR